MHTLEPSTLQVVAGFALLCLLFIAREIASGALREAGKDLWKRVRGRRNRHRASPRDGANRQ